MTNNELADLLEEAARRLRANPVSFLKWKKKRKEVEIKTPLGVQKTAEHLAVWHTRNALAIGSRDQRGIIVPSKRIPHVLVKVPDCSIERTLRLLHLFIERAQEIGGTIEKIKGTPHYGVRFNRRLVSLSAWESMRQKPSGLPKPKFVYTPSGVLNLSTYPFFNHAESGIWLSDTETQKLEDRLDEIPEAIEDIFATYRDL